MLWIKMKPTMNGLHKCKDVIGNMWQKTKNYRKASFSFSLLYIMFYQSQNIDLIHEVQNKMMTFQIYRKTFEYILLYLKDVIFNLQIEADEYNTLYKILNAKIHYKIMRKNKRGICVWCSICPEIKFSLGIHSNKDYLELSHLFICLKYSWH